MSATVVSTASCRTVATEDLTETDGVESSSERDVDSVPDALWQRDFRPETAASFDPAAAAVCVFMPLEPPRDDFPAIFDDDGTEVGMESLPQLAFLGSVDEWFRGSVSPEEARLELDATRLPGTDWTTDGARRCSAGSTLRLPDADLDKDV